MKKANLEGNGFEANGGLIKSIRGDIGAFEASGEDVTDQELELINGYTRKKFSKDQVYVFTVVLCDNDVDRDYQRFPVETLTALEKMFVGKSGIFDHNPVTGNQTARIFSCATKSVEGVLTATGDEYFRLEARAYIPRGRQFDDVIYAIESGIKKEVSVGCSVAAEKCSICGENIGTCGHRKGEVYGGKLCFGELVEPVDAYEWSFVAVPAQREAGVIKSYFEGGERSFSMEEILKSIVAGEGLNLDPSQTEKLCEYIEKLKKTAADGAVYRNELKAAVKKYSAIIQPDISEKTVEKIISGLSVRELSEIKSSYEKKARGILGGCKPQLAPEKTHRAVSSGKEKNNKEFKI